MIRRFSYDWIILATAHPSEQAAKMNILQDSAAAVEIASGRPAATADAERAAGDIELQALAVTFDIDDHGTARPGCSRQLAQFTHLEHALAIVGHNLVAG
jgi:hypothetical protein